MATVELRGKVALVTGSARRVGRAIALELARCGMHLVIHHSNKDADAESAAHEIGALGVETAIVKADQSQPAEVERMFDAIRARFGRLDLLVNNASTFERGSIIDLPFEDWQHTLGVNLTGPFLCSQHAARLMREKGGGGTIVNILDMSALKPWKSYPAHSVSKAGLASLTEVMALSLAPDIRVNAVALASVLRDEERSPEQWEAIGKRLPIGHTGDPSDAAQAVIFLATQPFITGTILRVDGGDYLRAAT